MTSYIKVFTPDSAEFGRLQAAAEQMTKRSPRGYHYYVGDTYFDMGQGRVWTTILSDGGCFGYQALTPREQEQILTGDMDAAIASVFANKYCPDKPYDQTKHSDISGLFAI